MKTYITGLILAVSCLSFVPSYHATYVRAKTQDEILDQHIQRIFGNKAKIATAVFTHESGMNLRKVNYDCTYIVNGKKQYTFCHKGDEAKAWSVDCGIGQINTKGKVCPEHLLTLEGNVIAIEKVYKEQGLQAWVSYTSGAYKKYL